jgi:hypothetical protein
LAGVVEQEPQDGPRPAEEPPPPNSDPVDWFAPADDIGTPIYDQLLAELSETQPLTDQPPHEQSEPPPQ